MKMGPDLIIALGKAAKKKKDGEGDYLPKFSDEKDSEDMNHDSEVASEILDAIDKNDPDALAEALKAFVEGCCND